MKEIHEDLLKTVELANEICKYKLMMTGGTICTGVCHNYGIAVDLDPLVYGEYDMERVFEEVKNSMFDAWDKVNKDEDRYLICGKYLGLYPFHFEIYM